MHIVMYKMLETLRVTLIRVEIQELHAVPYNLGACPGEGRLALLNVKNSKQYPRNFCVQIIID